MKIVEYTLGLPPYRRGGLPRYSTDLSKELAKNNDVYLMYPGEINPFSKQIKLKNKCTSYPFHVIELKNMLPVSLGLGISDSNKFDEFRDISELITFIDKLNLHVVHFHTLMGVPKEFLEYLRQKQIKTVLTTHDFYGLCPKVLEKNPLKSLTNIQCTDDCMLCKMGPSYIKLLIMQSHLYEHFKESDLIKKLRQQNKDSINSKSLDNQFKFSIEQANDRLKLRQYYLDVYGLIDEFHFNSSISKNYFKRFLPNINGKVIPITHAGLSDQRKNRKYKKHDNLVVGYVGPYDHKKGFFRMQNIYKRLDGVAMDFYGDIVTSDFFNQSRVTNHGIVPSSELTEAYKKMDVLVVPSVWHETFGFVVLEALLSGTPCLVSDTVGSKDLVPQNWVFSTDNELIDKLNFIKKNIDTFRLVIRKLPLCFDMSEHVNIIKQMFYKEE